MRIAFVIPYFYPALHYGGTPRIVYEIARALARRGHFVRVLTTDSGGPDRLRVKPGVVQMADGLEVYYYRNLSNRLAFWRRLFCPPQFFRNVRRQIADCDVVHIHEFRNLLTVGACRAAVGARVPLLLSPHGGLPRFGKERLKGMFDALWGRGTLMKAAVLCAVSPSEEQAALEFGIDARKIAMLPNAIYVDDFKNLASPASFAKKWGLADRRIILFLGRLHRIKGADILVAAFGRLSGIANLHLVIAGPDDGEKAELDRMIAEAGLHDRITFTGFLNHEQKLEAFAASHVVVLPSRSEGFPLTVLEALACERPIILSSACSVAGWFESSPSITTFESENVKDLAEKLETATLADYDRTPLARSREFVLRKFSVESIAERAETLYAQAASGTEIKREF